MKVFSYTTKYTYKINFVANCHLDIICIYYLIVTFHNISNSQLT